MAHLATVSGPSRVRCVGVAPRRLFSFAFPAILLSGTVFTPDGLYVYPHVLETVVCITPRNATDLSRYLSSIVYHNLVPHDQQDALRFLSRVVVRPTWEWNEATSGDPGQHAGSHWRDSNPPWPTAHVARHHPTRCSNNNEGDILLRPRR